MSRYINIVMKISANFQEVLICTHKLINQDISTLGLLWVYESTRAITRDPVLKLPLNPRVVVELLVYSLHRHYLRLHRCPGPYIKSSRLKDIGAQDLRGYS